MSSVKSLVLLSGGLDSTYNLVRAAQEGDELTCLFCDYGQLAAASEERASRALAKKYGAEYLNLDLKWIAKESKSALHQSEAKIPTGSQLQIDSKTQSERSADQVWVPNRNGLLLNAAAVFAEARDLSRILIGFNREEAETFPDNSKDFLVAINKSFLFSTRGNVQVSSYSVDFDKARMVKDLLEYNFDWSHIWPCYKSQEKWCGDCESCQRTLRALSVNGVSYTFKGHE